MIDLSSSFIRTQVAESDIIFKRGERIYEHGTFMCAQSVPEEGVFVYDVDGNYGDYTTRIQVSMDGVKTSCDCPFPGKGCKHTVAVLLDVQDRLAAWKSAKLNQRIGRVSRIGQKSGCVNVVNLICKYSIEESILAGIQLKTDLFDGAFDAGPDRMR